MIRSDRWIRTMALEHKLLDPFVGAHDGLGFYGPFVDEKSEADDFALAHNGRVVELRPPALASTYTCQHCGIASPKGQWGPGHVRCPRCGKVALSAAEAAPFAALPAVPRGHCGRCDRCGWELVVSSRLAGAMAGRYDPTPSCRLGDCSMRPLPDRRKTCAGCGAPFDDVTEQA